VDRIQALILTAQRALTPESLEGYKEFFGYEKIPEWALTVAESLNTQNVREVTKLTALGLQEFRRRVLSMLPVEDVTTENISSTAVRLPQPGS